MKFARTARRARTPGAVELAPLIDVVFLLLIFFMVSTTFVQRTELEVQLPEAGGGLANAQVGDIEVRISATGRYTVNDRVLASGDMQALRSALAAVRSDDSRVVIAADAAVSHQAVVAAMAAAGGVGVRDVRIVTRPTENERQEHDDSAG